MARADDEHHLAGWLHHVNATRTRIQQHIRNAVGTPEEVDAADFQNCITMSDLMASFGVCGVRLSLHETEVLWHGLVQDCGYRKHYPILTFADFYDWQVARNRQLLDDHSHVLLVHILERHCFPQEFKYWAPMLDRAVELLDDEAEKRYFKHHPHATHAKPDALHACGCGNPGARHVEYSHHHLRSQFVIDHKSKMDREEAGFCT